MGCGPQARWLRCSLLSRTALGTHRRARLASGPGGLQQNANLFLREPLEEGFTRLVDIEIGPSSHQVDRVGEVPATLSMGPQHLVDLERQLVEQYRHLEALRQFSRKTVVLIHQIHAEPRLEVTTPQPRLGPSVI